MRELTIRQPQEEIELADQVDLDVFGIGEHHRAEFLDSASTVILVAAATRTKKNHSSQAQIKPQILSFRCRIIFWRKTPLEASVICSRAIEPTP
jgi:hypothetical protein